MIFCKQLNYKIYTLRIVYSLAAISSFITLPSCKKFVEVPPPSTDLVTASVFTDDTKATAVITGIYSRISASATNYAPGGLQSFTLVAGLSADELINNSTSAARAEFYVNSIAPSNTTNLGLWRMTYQYIYYANAALEGLAGSTGVSDATKKQLTGEAKFLRAFLHFYLVNCWGDIPYIKNTDYLSNAKATRLSKLDVYKQIIADLQDAQNLLPETYITGERIRPNKYTVTALLARVYLYTQDWVNAEAMASLIINASGTYALETDLNKVFLKDSKEAIWQLMPVLPNVNSSEGYNFIFTSTPTNTSLSAGLINSFETGDQRKTNWTGVYTSGGRDYYYPYKYKIRTASAVTEYSIVFRLAEQYLIRAEARAEQNKLTGTNNAFTDLNIIRTRAGLNPSTATDQQSILNAILQERRIELFCEWGHRWFDLKRTNTADQALGLLKSPNWQPTDVLYPIPQLEILNDTHLSQNTGY